MSPQIPAADVAAASKRGRPIASHVMFTGVAHAAGTLQHLAQSFVPSLADFCFIHLVERHSLRCAASAHATREGHRLVCWLARTTRVSRHDPVSTVAQVVRTGRPQVRTEIVVEPDPERPRFSNVMKRLGPRSAIVAPLVAGDRVLGTLTLCYSESGRRYSTRHLPAARRLARRVTAHLASGPTVLARRLPALRARA